VEASGGSTFLRIDGRGRTGEHCGPSWIRIRSFPGFADRDKPASVETIRVPSCTASAEGTVVIPAGDFIYGGPGEPATRLADRYVEPERVMTLPDYRIDRTEVSNAAFVPFVGLTRLTGFAVPTYPPQDNLGAPEMPATSIDAYEAEAYCRYMGKRLPTDAEWTKAARGGLRVGNAINPFPRRLYPWGTQWNPACVNLAGDKDGFTWVAPVGALACGASPYGVLNLAGNVAEWTAHEGQSEALRVVRGGAADSPPELDQVTTVFRNQREGRHFDFVIGVRCVSEADREEQSGWERH
jgi:formylglycine-generating enzyme required for sulfatase activity